MDNICWWNACSNLMHVVTLHQNPFIASISHINFVIYGKY